VNEPHVRGGFCIVGVTSAINKDLTDKLNSDYLKVARLNNDYLKVARLRYKGEINNNILYD
jgi:hypothetical protein